MPGFVFEARTFEKNTTNSDTLLSSVSPHEFRKTPKRTHLGTANSPMIDFQHDLRVSLVS